VKAAIFISVAFMGLCACQRDYRGNRDAHPQSPLSPQEGSSSQYPGSKLIDSLYYAKSAASKQ
jgi:hypothetical protein